MLFKKEKNKKIFWALGIIISLVFGIIAFRGFRWKVLYQVILSIDLLFLIIPSILMMLSFSLRAYRWKFFLPQNGHFTFSSRISGIAIGYFFSNILPGRIGDLLRPAYLSKINHQEFQFCLYSIIVERIWELVLFILLAVIFFKFSSSSFSGTIHINYYVLSIFTLAGVIFLFFTRAILKILFKVFTKLRIDFISKSIQDILKAFDEDFQLHRFLFIVFLSVTIFLLEGLFFVCLIKSVGISISIFDGFMVMIITALSIMLPSAPAAIGVFHYFCQLSLTMLGVNKDIALSAAILIHAYMFIFDFFFAIVCIAAGPLKSRYFLKTEYHDELK